MNQPKSRPGIGQLITLHSGKVSFFITLLLLLFFDAIKLITFDSIMPYLAGICIWAFLWQQCTRPTPPISQSGQSIVLIAAALLGIIVCLNLCTESFLQFPFTPLPFLKFIAVWGIVFLLLRHWCFKLPSDQPSKTVHILGSILFGLFSCAGRYAVFESIAMPLTHPVTFLLLCLLSFCSWSLLFCSTLNAFHYLFTHIEIQEQNSGRTKCIFIWGIAFIVCMAAYFPYLLTFYPGVVEYDSWLQLRQVLGDTYINHHPWLHTMMIKVIYDTGFAVFGSENRAVALYSLCSMGIFSSAYATSICYLYKKRVKKGWLILLLLFSAFSPINGIYSITMWKDIPFASTILFFILLICKLHDNMKQQKSNRIYWLLFIPVSFFMCFFRTNGLYAFLLILPVMLYIFRHQKKPFLLASGTVILMAFLYKGPVFQYFEVQDGDIIESLSIPAQQVAAVISYNGNISQEDLHLLEEIIDVRQVPEAYLGSPGCSDAIKDLVRETDNQEFISGHKGDFFGLWLRTGIRNPYYYFKAYVEETKGYWYHKDIAALLWNTYVFENGVGIVRECKLHGEAAHFLPSLLAFYRTHFDKYYSCGLYIYVLLFGFLESLRLKKDKWFVTAPLLGIWLTLLISTPLHSDLRYIFAIHTALPSVMLILMLKKGGN